MKTKTLIAAALATALVSVASIAGAVQPTTAPNNVTNPYSPAYGAPYRHGVIPTRETAERMQAWAHANAPQFAAPTASTGILSYGGGVQGVGVLSGQSKVYLVFYGSQWGTQGTDASGNLTFSNDSAGAGPAAQKMFRGIGTNGETWSAELTQWCDGSSVANGATTCPSNAQFIPYQQNILAGVWYDNSVSSPSQATAAQLANEAIKAAAHFGNTTAASNRYTYYVILSPKGTNPDNYKSPTNGYCAWHDYTADAGVSSPYGEMAFSNQPYNIDVGSSCGVGFVNSPGTLDGYTMTLGHEWHEMMSDQFPAGGWTNHTGGTYNGQENSDECAWIAAGQPGGAANITFSTGTFAEQASWSNDTGNCAISHAILTHTGGNVAPTANFSVVTSGLTATFTDSSTDSDGTISSRAWTFGDGGTSTATSPSHTYAAAGTYSVSLKVTDNGGLTNTKTVSVTVSTSSNVLSNGVAKTNLSAATGATLNYTMAVPSGASNLKFAISGGTGDADLYVKFGSAPTTSSYDCRPYISGNSETCNMTAQAGTYYVMVRAYSSFSGVSLVGSYTTGSTQPSFTNNTAQTICDLCTINSTIAVSGVTGAASSTLKVPVNITHTYQGDLKIDLIAPNGTTFNLWNRSGGGTDNINQTFTVNASSVTAPNGTWTLRVADQAAGDTGKLNSWGLQF